VKDYKGECTCEVLGFVNSYVSWNYREIELRNTAKQVGSTNKTVVLGCMKDSYVATNTYSECYYYFCGDVESSNINIKVLSVGQLSTDTEPSYLVSAQLIGLNMGTTEYPSKCLSNFRVFVQLDNQASTQSPYLITSPLANINFTDEGYFSFKVPQMFAYIFQN